MNDVRGRGLGRPALAKLVFAVAGIAVFGLGIRWNHAGVRWAGIALVAVAWAMRFLRSGRGPHTGT